jgi:type I restriction enzyme, S subunit
VSWTTYPLGMLFRRREQRNMAHLPLLSVYRDLGIVPRRGRTDNHNKASDDLSAYKHVEVGDLVLNKMKTWQGSLGISYYEGVVSPAYFVAQPCREFDRRFLHHLLRSKPLIAKYGARSKGIRPSQWDLPWDEFKTIKVALPPLATQKRIADFLDTETARIDALITKKRRMIELLEEQFQVLLSANLQKLANEWGTGPISSLCSEVTDCVNKTAPISDIPTPFRMIRTTNVRGGSILENDLFFVTPTTFKTWTRRGKLLAGDVVLTREAPVGEVGVVAADNSGLFLGQRLLMYRAQPGRALSTYISLVLQSSLVQDQMELLGTGSLHEHLRVGDCSKFKVPLASKNAQQVFLDTTMKSQTRTDELTAALSTQLALLAERRQALITAAVTGELAIPEVAA